MNAQRPVTSRRLPKCETSFQLILSLQPCKSLRSKKWLGKDPSKPDVNKEEVECCCD